MAVTTAEISEALQLAAAYPPVSLTYAVTDSRQITFPAETLFVALKTDKRDGHLYIPQAYEKGVRFFL
ncbi:MAG: hypothetical protein MUE71_07490, partial [Chitinophagaceae bacterium]|nr:hypothetical protein [Chitinophagaceae bacterium]